MIKLILKLFTNSKDMTRSERGATFVYVAILLPAFIGFIGLGVDIGLWQVTKRDTQIIADASAVAGALETMRFRADPDEADTNQAALAAAIANGYEAGSGLDGIVINDPPAAGPYAGTVGTVEVIMTRQAPIFFSTLFRTEPVFVRSRAVAASGQGDACIWALSPDDRDALRVAGGALVDIDCGVRVNSTDDFSVRVIGTGCLEATGVLVAGGTSGDCITPAPEPYPAGSDPLLGLLEPSYGACDHEDGLNHTSNQPVTLSPGVYCKSLSITGSGLVTFEPGLYVLADAAFTMGAQSNVYGAGVTFYLNPNKTSQQVDIVGGATVSLSAPTFSCDDVAWEDCQLYESILFFEARDAPVRITHKFAGGATMDLNGVLYFSQTDVQFSGGSQTDNSNISIIAYTIDFVGTVDVGEIVIVEGEEQIILPWNRLLVRVQLLE